MGREIIEMTEKHYGTTTWLTSDLSGRSEREIRTYIFLDSLGISFDRTDHPEQPATTMEVCAEVDAILDVHICKNLFLCNRQKTNFYLLVIPGDKPFKTKELSKQMGISRLSFADESFMEQFLDIHPGSVSVLGLMNDKEHRVSLAIDEDVGGVPGFVEFMEAYKDPDHPEHEEMLEWVGYLWRSEPDIRSINARMRR